MFLGEIVSQRSEAGQLILGPTDSSFYDRRLHVLQDFRAETGFDTRDIRAVSVCRFGSPDSFGPVTVEPGHYFMMGDHRNASSDSREWGLVPQDLIKGRAFMILFSTNAKAPPGSTPGKVTPLSLGRKVFNLVFRARWDRCFTAVR